MNSPKRSRVLCIVAAALLLAVTLTCYSVNNDAWALTQSEIKNKLQTIQKAMSLVDKLALLNKDQLKDAINIAEEVSRHKDILTPQQQSDLNELGLTSQDVSDAITSIKNRVMSGGRISDTFYNRLHSGDKYAALAEIIFDIQEDNKDLKDRLEQHGTSFTDLVVAAFDLIDITYTSFERLPDQVQYDLLETDLKLTQEQADKYGVNKNTVNNIVQVLKDHNLTAKMRSILDTLGAWYRGGGGGGGGGGAPAPQPAADITVGVDGGTFNTADGQAGLIVPEGALQQGGTIKIVLVTEPIPDPSMTFASNVYEFTSSVAFSGSVTINLKFDPAKVTDPSKLGIYYYNETLKQWVYIGGTVDMVTGTVSVTVDHFTKFAVMVNPARVKLTDIDNHWAYRFIDRLAGMGITNGYEDGTFKPERTITRAEFARIVAKAKNLPLESQATLSFSDAADVPEWARPAVAAAVKAGIIKGYEDNTFRPDKLISRAEMATMMVRAMSLTPAALPVLTFSDAGEIPQWAQGYVAAAVEKGIIKGKEGNKFDALSNATRAEAAAMVVRMLEALGI